MRVPPIQSFVDERNNGQNNYKRILLISINCVNVFAISIKECFCLLIIVTE